MRLLDDDEVVALNKRYHQRRPYLGGIWRHALIKRAYFLSADEQTRDVEWADLLVAVGNFKRQSPIAVLEGGEPSLSGPDPGDQVETPAGTLRKEEESTWQLIEGKTAGLGVATTTTVLAAIWPDAHAIIDRRSLPVAAALFAQKYDKWPFAIDPDGSTPLDVTWDTYSQYREILRAWSRDSHCSLTDVERALFMASPDTKEGRTWTQYRDDVISVIPSSPKRQSSC